MSAAEAELEQAAVPAATGRNGASSACCCPVLPPISQVATRGLSQIKRTIKNRKQNQGGKNQNAEGVPVVQATEGSEGLQPQGLTVGLGLSATFHSPGVAARSEV